MEVQSQVALSGDRSGRSVFGGICCTGREHIVPPFSYCDCLVLWDVRGGMQLYRLGWFFCRRGPRERILVVDGYCRAVSPKGPHVFLDRLRGFGGVLWALASILAAKRAVAHLSRRRTDASGKSSDAAGAGVCFGRFWIFGPGVQLCRRWLPKDGVQRSINLIILGLLVTLAGQLPIVV